MINTILIRLNESEKVEVQCSKASYCRDFFFSAGSIIWMRAQFDLFGGVQGKENKFLFGRQVTCLKILLPFLGLNQYCIDLLYPTVSLLVLSGAKFDYYNAVVLYFHFQQKNTEDGC